MADPRVTLHLGDCLDVLRGLPDGSVDAVVTDPPAGIAFMGKRWDTFKRDQFIDFLRLRLAECYRIARPDARALIWAIPRTSHWTGMAIEDAGWRIEDRVSHLFGTGFPKHKSKLKPACEDWWLAIKPAGKAVPLEIDRCRIGTTDDLNGGAYAGSTKASPTHSMRGPLPNAIGREFVRPAGRWPANVCLSHSPGCREVGTKRVKTGTAYEPDAPRKHQVPVSPGKSLGRVCGYADPDGLETVPAWECEPTCAIRLLDEQSGERRPGERPARGNDTSWFGNNSHLTGERIVLNSGGASRFLYCTKASRADRGEGNTHNTVKNTDLMRWLCRLITPPGGTVLDPFAGSGSTGKACIAEGFNFIGIESDPGYFAIAQRRLGVALEHAHARP